MGLLLLDIAEVTLQGALGAMSDGRIADVDIGRATAQLLIQDGLLLVMQAAVMMLHGGRGAIGNGGLEEGLGCSLLF